MHVKLKIVESRCRCAYHKAGDVFVVKDLCPPICHELWQCIYPSVYALINGGSLDYGLERSKKFKFSCPDEGRVLIEGWLEDE